MSLKTRLQRLESVIKPESKDVCIFMTTVYPAGEMKPPVLGYRSDIKLCVLKTKMMMTLQARAESVILDKTARQNCGLKFALVFEVFNNHSFIPTEEET